MRIRTRIRDARTGRLVDFPAAGHGLLGVYAHASCARRHFDLSDLRVLLVTDLLFRVAELGGLQVVLGLGLPDLPEEQVKALAGDCDLLNIHPLTMQVGTHDAGRALGRPADVRVVGHAPGLDGTLDQVTDGIRVDVGPVHAARPPISDDASSALEFPGVAPNPLAVRLTLLRQAYREPAEVTGDMLVEAQETLDGWRREVAGWAQAPSSPMHADTVRAAHTCFGEDLDVVSALGLLRRLGSEDGVAAGAKFETFVHLDRVLGLELAGEIGRPSPQGTPCPTSP